MADMRHKSIHIADFHHKSSLEKMLGLEGGASRAAKKGTGVDIEADIGASAPIKNEEDVLESWKSTFLVKQVAEARREELKVPASLSSRTIFKIMHSTCVRSIVNIVILINAIEMGIAADYKGGDWDDIWYVCDHFFTLVFALEMVLQLWALRQYYFTSGWNIADFVIAWIAILNTWFMPLLGKQNSSLGAVRVFRLLRLFRLVKIMKIVPELMMVVEGIMYSLKQMFWIFMLLVLVLYMAGICCVEVIGLDKDAYPAWSEDAKVIETEVVEPFNNYLYFGTVLRSMVSCFSLVLLDEWSTIVRPVYEVQRIMLVFFVALVVLCSFGIMNVIVGVVVERTTQAMNTLRQSQVELLKQKQSKEVIILAHIMFDLDEDQDNRITRQEFEKGSKNEKLREMLMGIGLPAGFTFLELFHTLDVDGSGYLSKGEFVDGIMRLIHSNEFQRDCVVSCAIGQLKAASVKIRTDLQVEFRKCAMDLRRDFQELRVDIQTETSKIFSRSELLVGSEISRSSNTHAARIDSEYSCDSRDIDTPASAQEVREAHLGPKEATPDNGVMQQDETAAGCLCTAGPMERQTSVGEVTVANGAMQGDEPTVSKPLASRPAKKMVSFRDLTQLDQAVIQIELAVQENRQGQDEANSSLGGKPVGIVDIDDASLFLRSDWEPLQTVMMMPEHIAGLPESSTGLVPEAGASVPVNRSQPSNQSIIGYFPTSLRLGSVSQNAISPGDRIQRAEMCEGTI